MQAGMIWWMPRFFNRRDNFLKYVREHYPHLYKEYAREADAVESQNEIVLFGRDASYFKACVWILGFPRAKTELGKLDLIAFKKDTFVRKYRFVTVYPPFFIAVGFLAIFILMADDLLNLVVRMIG